MSKIILALGILISFNVFAKDSKWNCTKDGKEISVEGKTPAEKKIACEKQSGKWAEKKADNSEQKSGGGGGW